MKKAELFSKEKEPAGSVRCLACAHKCLISKDDVGICGVRKNIDGELYLLVYGLVAAMHVDPIEKKPIYNFLSTTNTFSIGTVGCNFKCRFCQNYDLSHFMEHYGEIIGEEITPEKIVQMALETGCKSISYTYNEPTIFAEFVKDTAVLAKKEGLKNILVTNGYLSEECLEYLSDVIDAMNIDLKSFSEEFYQRICGANLKPVLDTIKKSYEKGIHVEITTLVIPGENDSEEEFEKIASFIASINKEIPWHISRFFPRNKMLNKEPTSIFTLKKARDIGRKHLKNVYMGNV